jgi:hypothetical protein
MFLASRALTVRRADKLTTICEATFLYFAIRTYEEVHIESRVFLTLTKCASESLVLRPSRCPLQKEPAAPAE